MSRSNPGISSPASGDTSSNTPACNYLVTLNTLIIRDGAEICRSRVGDPVVRDPNMGLGSVVMGH